MSAEARGDVRAGIGTRLRAAREKKGLTVLQAAEKMHVDPRMLESLEAEDFASLGAAVYVKGHLRHYAELVGEQPAELQELYANSTHTAPVQPDLTRISRGIPEGNPGKLAGPAVVVIVAVAAIGVLWWLFSSPSEKPRPTKVQESAQNNIVPDSEAPVEAPTAPAIAAPPAPTALKSGQKVKGAAAPTPSGLLAANTVGPAPSKATASAAAFGTRVAAVQTAASTTSAATAPLPARSKQGELTLKFSSDSWAEVYDASGQRLFYDVGAASSAHTVRGPAPMRVVLGNASGVALEYNGRPTLIPSAVMPDGSVHFSINAHGRAIPATEGN